MSKTETPTGVRCSAWLSPERPNNTDNMKPIYTWPEIFEDETLIATSDQRSLCADGMCAWSLCMSGNVPPKSFGEVLVKVAARLGMQKAPTVENFNAHAIEHGWLNDQAQRPLADSDAGRK